MMKLKIHKFIFDNQLQSIFFKDDSSNTYSLEFLGLKDDTCKSISIALQIFCYMKHFVNFDQFTFLNYEKECEILYENSKSKSH